MSTPSQFQAEYSGRQFGSASSFEYSSQFAANNPNYWRLLQSRSRRRWWAERAYLFYILVLATAAALSIGYGSITTAPTAAQSLWANIYSLLQSSSVEVTKVLYAAI